MKNFIKRFINFFKTPEVYCENCDMQLFRIFMTKDKKILCLDCFLDEKIDERIKEHENEKNSA